MRIGIDARAIISPEKIGPTGAASYVWHLINNLLSIDNDSQYVLFFDFHVRDKDVQKFTKTNVKIKFFPFSDYKKYLPGAYNEILGAATFARENLDVLHATSPTFRVPTTYRGKVVTTFYDFAPYRISEMFSRLAVAKTKALYSFMGKKSDRIIAVSESTKKDAMEFLKFPEEKIEVVYNGIDARFFELIEAKEGELEEKYGIKKKYMLFLGTLEPRKNLVRVMEALAKWKKDTEKNFSHQLVIVGKRGWLADEYRQLAKDLEIESDVIFTGYVAGDELKPLYASADAFVMPSLWEGFGQTIVEAMACGTPVITSKISSIPEVAGDAALFVDPHDTDGIAKAMKELAGNPDLRQELGIKGIEQAKKFNWEKCARETLEVYTNI